MKCTCLLCPHHCALEEGQTGFCRGRANRGGRIVSLSYGRITSLALDPIEKKPLAEFYPGSFVLSVGSFGCNLHCPFCQNHEISMAGEETETGVMLPDQLVEQALALRRRGNIGIAFTYNEPLIGYEYVLDTARAAKASGLKTVLVSNGMIACEPFLQLLPYLDALNIDLKGFREEVYSRCGMPQQGLETVKQNIRSAMQQSHTEITTLVVPGLNDAEEEMEQEAAWLAGIDPSAVLHLSRFFPRYRMTDTEPTPLAALQRLRQTALHHLQHVYLGNC